MVRELLGRGLRVLPAPALSPDNVALLFDAPAVRACVHPLETLVQENYARAPGSVALSLLADVAESIAAADTVRWEHGCWAVDTRFVRRFLAVLAPARTLSSSATQGSVVVRMPAAGAQRSGVRRSPAGALRRRGAVRGGRGSGSSASAPPRRAKRARRTSTRAQPGQTVNMLQFLTRR